MTALRPGAPGSQASVLLSRQCCLDKRGKGVSASSANNLESLQNSCRSPFTPRRVRAGPEPVRPPVPRGARDRATTVRPARPSTRPLAHLLQRDGLVKPTGCVCHPSLEQRSPWGFLGILQRTRGLPLLQGSWLRC